MGKNLNLKCQNMFIDKIKTSGDPDNYWALIPCIWVDGKGQTYSLPTFDWEKLRLQVWYSASIQPPRREGLSATVVLQETIDRDGNPIQLPESDNPFDDPTISKQYYTAAEILNKMRSVREKSILVQSDIRAAASMAKSWDGFAVLYVKIKVFRETEENK